MEQFLFKGYWQSFFKLQWPAANPGPIYESSEEFQRNTNNIHWLLKSNVYTFKKTNSIGQFDRL